jgi:hypothetical protein
MNQYFFFFLIFAQHLDLFLRLFFSFLFKGFDSEYEEEFLMDSFCAA